MAFSENTAIAEAIDRLEDLIGKPAQVEMAPNLRHERRADAIVRVGEDAFLLEVKGSSSPATIAGATAQLLQYAEQLPGPARPTLLLVVPYMPPSGRAIAADRGVSWLDLSGNAHIRTPRTLIRIEGEANRFKERGRPSTPFAPKSSRIARWLLMHPGQEATQSELADATGVDRGQVSRVVQRLLRDQLVTRSESGAIVAPDPDLLLEAWRAEYDFEKHTRVAGNVPARSGPDGLVRITRALEDAGVEYAATGLAGAWLLTRFAGFRLVTLYVRGRIPPRVLDALGFVDDPRGANTWIVTPSDTGVFDGASKHDDVTCVHPVQVYLDLASHPERASEAAEEIKRRLLRWGHDAG